MRWGEGGGGGREEGGREREGVGRGRRREGGREGCTSWFLLEGESGGRVDG